MSDYRSRQEDLATQLRAAWKSGDVSWLGLADIALKFVEAERAAAIAAESDSDEEECR